jgi:hypothetical protein
MGHRVARIVLIAAAVSAPAAARAAAPAWVSDPCAGLDCAATPAGVGQSSLLPELSISSAIAYAQAARSLSGSLTEFVSVSARQYAEDTGQETAEDSAVKDMVKSPLGAALTKNYASNDADTISVSIELTPLPDAGARVFSQEFVDESSGTLYVRLILDRSGNGAAPDGFSAYPGRRVRLNSQDVRVGRYNEFTLWVQDDETGLTWVEEWPMGGADLMKGGQVSASYVFDSAKERWKPTSPAIPAAPAAPADAGGRVP